MRRVVSSGSTAALWDMALGGDHADTLRHGGVGATSVADDDERWQFVVDYADVSIRALGNKSNNPRLGIDCNVEERTENSSSGGSDSLAACT